MLLKRFCNDYVSSFTRVYSGWCLFPETRDCESEDQPTCSGLQYVTANPDLPRPFPFPQIGLNMHYVNKQNPDIPRTRIYRGGCSFPPKSGFYCITIIIVVLCLTWCVSAVKLEYYGGNVCSDTWQWYCALIGWSLSHVTAYVLQCPTTLLK